MKQKTATNWVSTSQALDATVYFYLSNLPMVELCNLRPGGRGFSVLGPGPSVGGLGGPWVGGFGPPI